MFQSAAENHQRRHCWHHRRNMRLPAGSGQDETAEPEGWTERRKDVQIHVSMVFLVCVEIKSH